jgi:hypothetical protein
MIEQEVPESNKTLKGWLVLPNLSTTATTSEDRFVIMVVLPRLVLKWCEQEGGITKGEITMTLNHEWYYDDLKQRVVWPKVLAWWR